MRRRPRVFEAFADPVARMRWGVPSANVELVYLEADFRVGGRDVSRCGPAGNLMFHVDLTYLDIVPDAAHRLGRDGIAGRDAAFRVADQRRVQPIGQGNPAGA